MYADWLLEHGDLRGRIVALEDRLPEAGSRREVRQIREAIEAIAVRYRARWRSLDPGGGLSFGWRRGFVVSVELFTQEAIARLPEMLAHSEARLLARVRIGSPQVRDRDLDASLAKLGAHDLRQIEVLRLPDVSLGPGWTHFVRTARLDALARLDLRYTGLTDEGVEALASASGLPQLASLSLQRNRVGFEGAIALAGAPGLSRLAHLDLRYNPIGAAGAEALARLGGLEQLLVYPEDVGEQGVEALRRSPNPRIRRYWRCR